MYDKLEKKYGKEFSNFITVKSKHQLEDLKKDIQDFINCKYPHRKGRILGSSCKAMSEDMYHKLLNYAKTINVKLYIAILIEGELGIRVGDVVTLKLENFDLVNGYVFLHNSKSNKEYSLPLNNFIRDELEDYFNYFMGEIIKFDNYILFPNDFRHHPKIKHLTSHYVNKKLKECIQVIGGGVVYGHSSDGRPLHLFTSHSLRGRAASYIYEKGNNNIRMAQRLLDHSPRTDTQVYLRNNEEDFEKLIRSD